MNLKDKILFGIVAILRSNLFTLMVRLLNMFETKDISISDFKKGIRLKIIVKTRCIDVQLVCVLY